MSRSSAHWFQKFRCAFRGIREAVAGDTSFHVHLPCAVLVIGTASFFRLGLTEWCLLLLCISTVLAAECFNSSIEALAKVVTAEHDPQVGRALDIAAGAVLIASVGAAIVGATIFIPAALNWLEQAAR